MPVSSASFSRETYQSFFKESLGRVVELRDGGKKGEVDPGDVLVYRKDGKLVRTTVGITRFEQAKMQLCVVNAAKQFAAAGVNFSGRSADDACNKKFWWMGFGGRLGVRADVKPSDAINDVFKNGSMYGMECATATMIILYKAILDRVGPEDFDRSFAKLKIFRWQEEDADFTAAKQVGKLPGFLPGDHTYFKNPDASAENSSWGGENVIYLGDGMYFGHGVGLATKDEVLDCLNSLRRENATRKAFRDNFELRLDPKKIAKLDLNPAR